jgi:ATP-dependent helicase/nuclease subunit B
MSTALYLAPASSGKTFFALHLVRKAVCDLQSIPRLVVPSRLLVRACRRRLAEAGGAIGVRVLTFDHLYTECLDAAGEVYTQLSEPVQYRLIRAVIDHLQLSYYRPLVGRPGFVQALQGLLGEWKAARILPDAFAAAVADMGSEPRLRELADIYHAYQQRLQEEGWADWDGIAWLALEALEKRAPQVARDWPLVVVDGFDDFTGVQLAVLKVLSQRVGELVITLTGCTDADERPLVHRRFCRTLRRLEEALGVQPVPLPALGAHMAAGLAHLETNLYRGHLNRLDPAGAVQLLEAADRAEEVRAALRWLKARLQQGGLRPGEVALLARHIAPYRPFILQTAAEFGLPIRLTGGLPLASNPAIAALFDLLRVVVPRTEGDLQPHLDLPGRDDARPALSRRLVVEAWRSPYFDWSARPTEGAALSIGIEPGDADALDRVARWGQVIGGWEQWEEALASLSASSTQDEVDEERGRSANVPVGTEAQQLRDKFQRFVQRLMPPQGLHSIRDFVGWLEGLIGSDPQLASQRFPAAEEPTSLRMVEQVRQVPGTGPLMDTAQWDVAALRALKDVLRGLVWAEEAVDPEQMVDFTRFFSELEGAVQVTSYRLPLDPLRQEILVADVVQARGLSFRAVAVLGLAEGEFPAPLAEDPFLRDRDRERLREGFELPLDPSTASAEAEFFYETITRPRECLLLTRPRLADNGALWQASPYWEEVTQLLQVSPQALTGGTIPEPAQVASWPELMESLAAYPAYAEVHRWADQSCPERSAAMAAAAGVFNARQSEEPHGPFAGDLTLLAGEFVQRYGPQHVWSASRLEAYRTCPFLFFVGSVLGLEPRPEPQEGLDARQLGNIYHRIFEHLYGALQGEKAVDLEQLLAALPDVAGRILDQAPQREGFRATAWWHQTRQEIIENVRQSLQALHGPELQQGFFPIRHEMPFYEPHELHVCDGEDCFRLHGVIDRVERDADGRVRIIDYKTAGPSRYTNPAVTQGKKIQLPLYALAARDALRLGEPFDGFYWHVRQAQPSSFTLRKYRQQHERDALEVAVEKAWEVVRSARNGDFRPHVPDGGCPHYCPAVAFCWLYQPAYGG